MGIAALSLAFLALVVQQSKIDSPQQAESIQSQGQNILDRMLSARVGHGRVTLEEDWSMDTGDIRSRWTGVFTESQFRTDVHYHSALTAMQVNKFGQCHDPVLSLAWDGTKVLRTYATHEHKQHSIRELNDTGIPFYNARFLGIPLIRDPQAAPDAYRDVIVDHLDQNDGEYLITFRPAGRTVQASRATFVIDRKTFALRSYDIAETTDSGVDFRLIGDIIPEQHGKGWYPAWCRHEQWRNGDLQWARETTVLEAEFGQPIEDRMFTWSEFDIDSGSVVLSYSAQFGSGIWNGESVVPVSVWQAAQKKAAD